MAEPVVRTSTRLWSQEVAQAEAQAGIVQPRNKEPGYEFAGGSRKFDSGLGAYAPAPDPAPGD
ncbi:MAG: hypothetical protein WC322_03810 [Candidatus Paceibacterota bacterium]|jgi:hypothetical protein